MAAAIRHRGPDGLGFHRDGDIQLASVRLAILDLEKGGQPAYNTDRSISVVYNGELYNYKDLAGELKLEGAKLDSRGDTIVLPYLYERHGPHFVQRLRGMFAFALWDARDKRLHLFRDRLGIKPLYYACNEDFLIFASEIKGILASGLITSRICRRGMEDLFSMSYPCPPRTMFEGIFELLPGRQMCVRAGDPHIQIERYWRAPFTPVGQHRRLNRRDVANEFRERLTTRVEDHLISDVKVGTYLSGGIDSSAVTALVRQKLAGELESFTICFPGQQLDEGDLAAKQAAEWGLKHHRVECGAEMAEMFSDMIYHTELPLQYPLALPFMKMSAAVREAGVKVIMTGEGADELLAGYDCFRLERLRRALDLPGLSIFKRKIYSRMFSFLGSPDGIADFFLDVQSRPNDQVSNEWGGVRPPWYDIWHALDYKREGLFSEAFQPTRSVSIPPDDFADLVRPDLGELHPLDAAIAIELETRLPSWTVLVDDRASMANGIETRVPFLDHDLVEWICQLPPEFKLRGLEEKSVLRDAVKGVLNREVAKRKKRSFYSPIKDWFFSERSPAFVREFLSESSLKAAGMFNPEMVRSHLQQLDRLPENSFLRHRLEWLLILVLGCQTLHDRFVRKL